MAEYDEDNSGTIDFKEFTSIVGAGEIVEFTSIVGAGEIVESLWRVCDVDALCDGLRAHFGACSVGGGGVKGLAERGGVCGWCGVRTIVVASWTLRESTSISDVGGRLVEVCGMGVGVAVGGLRMAVRVRG